MHKVLVASCLAAAALADAEPGYLGLGYGYGYGYGLGGVSTGVGLHPTGVVYESRLEVSALELVFTQQDQSMSPDQHRVLVREVLMLSQATTLRTTGHQLLLLMATPPAMDAVASVALSQVTLVLDMDMAMVMD
eukprot:TRINITY_DN63_c0_g1_i10.p1 TRINITY_DN63_c0_g1~~TRINITY_DN63_c0_g1_i10.p1  ORF type:complete len:134 (-),score=25.06 TRINITY_DN63_c0_g1_i10:80-481(-)